MSSDGRRIGEGAMTSLTAGLESAPSRTLDESSGEATSAAREFARRRPCAQTEQPASGGLLVVVEQRWSDWG
jgi:hypothetical protein